MKNTLFNTTDENNIKNFKNKISHSSFRTLFKSVFSDESPKKYIGIFSLILAVSLLAELFLFNYKWVVSSMNNPEYPEYTIANAVKQSDGKYKSNGDEMRLVIKDIDKPLSFLEFNIAVEDEESVPVTICAKDEANNNWLEAPSLNITNDVQRSHYPRLHFSGDVSELSVKFKVAEDKTFDIKSLALNPNVPLMFSLGRALFVWIILSLIFLFRPGSFLYKYKTDAKIRWQSAVLLVLIVAIAAGFWPLSKLDPWCDRKTEETVQYQMLAEALTRGEVHIAEETDPKMLNLENPYDSTARGSLGRWDTAYYEGKYYVYFGIAPALLYYLPYYIATGEPMTTSTAVYISCVLAAAATLFALYQLARRWFKNTPFGVYLIVSLICIIGGGIIFTVKRPDFYPLPIITAAMFAMFGLGLWLSAVRVYNNGEKTLSPAKLFFGSLLMAAVAASRPQILFTSLFAIPIFWNEVFKDRLLFSKNGLKNTVAVCLPYLIIGALVMWYNYARFGSPFDFGANYNLTSNDMTKRGFVFGRIGLGLFTYLLQIPQIKATFPFLNIISVESAYQGLTQSEKFFGGVMATEPLLWAGVIGIFSKKLFKDKRLYAFTCLSFAISIALVILDTQMAGLLRRYFGDFLWIMYLGAAASCFAIYKYLNKNTFMITARTRRFINILIVCFVIAAAFHGLEIFVDSGGWGIIKSNITLYQKMQYLIAFWM